MNGDANTDAEIEASLRRLVRRDLGTDIVRVLPLPGQLGTRRFYRLELAAAAPGSLIARVEQPEDASSRPAGAAAEPPLEPIRALLERAGCPVPRRFGGDAKAEIELLEDLGDISLCAALEESSEEERRALYTEACGLIPTLQKISDPGDVEAFRRHLDDELFAFKANLFARFALTAGGRTATVAERDVVRAAFGIVASECARVPGRLAHRDFQSANLQLVPGRGLVMIDFQGAFLAPPEYDLVCLLRDSYVCVSDDEVASHLEATRPLLPDAPDPDEFSHRFDLLTLTRKGKDLARFRQAAAERDDSRFLPHVPNTLRMLQDAGRRAAARDPRFADFAELCGDLGESTCAP